jgi:hypothetical protein
MGAPSVQRFAVEVQKLFSKNRMVVFLCGPTLSAAEENPASALRLRLRTALEAEDFEVVLGEDDGLEDIRVNGYGGYAHDNELEFIKSQCGAIVVVAGSAGSFCELGLFAHWHANSTDKKCDLILLAEAQYEGHPSYFNYGPASAANDFGKVYYVDFKEADIQPIIERLKRRRSAYIFSGQGKPAKGVGP